MSDNLRIEIVCHGKRVPPQGICRTATRWLLPSGAIDAVAQQPIETRTVLRRLRCPNRIHLWIPPVAEVRIHVGPPETLRNFERKVCNNEFLGSHSSHFQLSLAFVDSIGAARKRAANANIRHVFSIPSLSFMGKLARPSAQDSPRRTGECASFLRFLLLTGRVC
jgi:hypothetical protein